ncbi:MAG: hypothetical protein E7238_03235 [Sarcina sp.]|nr:hypothetical protein [Sarcina sp.]
MRLMKNRKKWLRAGELRRGAGAVGKRNGGKRVPALLAILLCMVLLAGCGRSLVITTGFGRGEVFRLGKARGRISEIRVYMLDLQKQSEALYGQAIWDSADAERMQQAVKDQALSQLTRVKALGQIAISRNVMLTKEEERRTEEAVQACYAGFSEEEKKYLDLDEKDLLKMYREYALADRMWKSLGDSAEETYEDYYRNTQCDLNTRYWQKVSLKRVEGDPAVPGFAQCYQNAFEGLDFFEMKDKENEGDGQEDPEAGGAEEESSDAEKETSGGEEESSEAEKEAEKEASDDGAEPAESGEEPAAADQKKAEKSADQKTDAAADQKKAEESADKKTDVAADQKKTEESADQKSDADSGSDRKTEKQEAQ